MFSKLRFVVMALVLFNSKTGTADILRSAWNINVGCPASGSGNDSREFRASNSNGLRIGKGSCRRTPTNFTKLTAEEATGGTLRSQTVYALHTGEVLIIPPLGTNEFQPIFTVNTVCPTSNRTVNWLYVQWNDGAVSLTNTYLLGTADIRTNGGVLLKNQYDLNGALYWSGASNLDTNGCYDGVTDVSGAANLGGRLYWTASDGGVFKTNPGKATFFLPAQTVSYSSLGGQKIFQGVTFDSSSGNAASDIRNIKAMSSNDGKSLVIQPYSDPEVGVLDSSSQGFLDTVTFTSINAPSPGMILGQVSRSSSACSNRACTGKLACIARTAGGSGFRLICSGQSPVDNAIPYNFTLFRPYACPAGFVKVAKDSGVNVDDDFCVAKYEMKNVGGNAVSEAAGTPWVNVDRNTAIARCQALGTGYDLITNAEWQAVARNVENAYEDGYYSNWTNGAKTGSNALIRGHSDNSPARALAASQDDDVCAGTGNSACANADSNSFVQKRVFTLSSGKFVWDLGGNVSEWVKSPNLSSQGTNGNLSLDPFTLLAGKVKFGARGNYTASGPNPKTVSPFGGFGAGLLNYASGGIVRGGNFSDAASGVFSTALNVAPSAVSPQVGFRCAFHTAAVSPAGSLVFMPGQYSAGNVELSSTATSAIYILANEGNGPATLSNPPLSLSGAGMSVTGSTCTAGLQLAPGQSCSVQASFAPTAPGEVKGAVTANWTAAGVPGDQASQLSLTGTGIQVDPAILAFNPPSYDFGGVQPAQVSTAGSPASYSVLGYLILSQNKFVMGVGMGASTAMRVAIPGTTPSPSRSGPTVQRTGECGPNEVISYLGSTANPWSSFNCSALVGMERGDSRVLYVPYGPNQSGKCNDGEVLFGINQETNYDRDKPNGVWTGRLALKCAKLVNPSYSRNIVLTNSGKSDAVFSTVVTPSGSGLSVQSSNCPNQTGKLAPGASCSMQVRFAPTLPGSYTGNLRVTWTSKGVTGVQATRMELKGIGMANGAGPLLFLPASYNFGSLPLGTTTAPISLSLMNAGMQPLRILGSFFQNNTPFVVPANRCTQLGTVLAPGEVCTFPVQYTATTIGAVVSSISVNWTGGSGINVATMPATATGVAAPVLAGPLGLPPTFR